MERQDIKEAQQPFQDDRQTGEHTKRHIFGR